MQNTHSLKVGDKVLCTKDYSSGSFKSGEVYTVDRPCKFGERVFVVSDSFGAPNGWNCENFEKVADAQDARVGKYRAVSDGKNSYVTIKQWRVIESTFAQNLTPEAAELIANSLNAQVSA